MLTSKDETHKIQDGVKNDIASVTYQGKGLWAAIRLLLVGNGTGLHHFVIAHEGTQIRDIPSYHRGMCQNLRISSYVLPPGPMNQEQIHRAIKGISFIKVKTFSLPEDDKVFFVYSYWKTT